MLETKRTISLPTMKVTVEYLLRVGLPNEESLSPYPGGYSLIQEQLGGKMYDFYKILAHGEVSDWEARAFPVVAGKYSSDKEARRGPPLTHLEDIDESWFYERAKGYVIGIKTNNKGGLNEYEYNNQETAEISDDEGNTIAEAEFVEEYESDYTPEEIVEARTKVLYLVKRLHERSKTIHIDLISLVIAFEKARATCQGKNISAKDLVANTVYTMGENGIRGRKVLIEDNTKKDFPTAQKWILGKSEPDSYLDNVHELLACCTILGVDIKKENPLDYTEELISGLVTQYIASNREYVMGKHRGTCRQTKSALREMSIDSYESLVIAEPKTREDYTQNLQEQRQSLFESTKQMYYSYFGRDYIYNAEWLKEFERWRWAYNLAKDPTVYHKQEYLDSTYLNYGGLANWSTEDGFFIDKKGLPVVINVTPWYKHDNCNTHALLHASGYLVKLTSVAELQVLQIPTFTEYLLASVTEKEKANFKIFDGNVKFGTWNILI